MAEVKRTLITALRKKPLAAAGKTVTLPISVSEPVHDINQYHFLIHGEKKIGKTTLTTIEKGVFLITFDPLQKALDIFQVHCPDWQTFDAYLKELEKAAAAGRYPYRRVVVDGCDIWYRRCQAAVCSKLVIDHPADEDWGKGWDMLKTWFAGAVDRLLALPGGCWFITHSEWRQVETRQKGIKLDKLLPLMKGGAEDILVGRVDGWFAYDYWGEERILIVRGDERTGAGNRCRGHFLTPDNRPVIEIPMGEDEYEAWENLNAAFRNEQTFCTLAERDTPQNSAAPRPLLVRKPILVPAARKPLLKK